MEITSVVLFLLVILIFCLTRSISELKKNVKQMEIDKQYQLKKQMESYQRYQKANAIIINMTFESDYHNWINFLLSVNYVDANGVNQEGKLYKSFNYYSVPQIGDNLTIYYDPRTDIISEKFYTEQFS